MIKFKEHIKLFKSVYPRYLTLLVLIPIFVGYFVDFSVSNKWYELFVSIIWLPLFTIPYQLTGKKIFYKIAVVLFFVIGLLEIAHWLVLKGPVTIASLVAFSNTNYDEATEFLSVIRLRSIILVLPYFILFLLALKSPSRVYNSNYKYLLMLLVGFIIGMYFYYPIDRFLVRLTPNFVRVSHAFSTEMKDYRKALKNNSLKEVDAVRTMNNDKQLFVLIIGESASKNHMSLYNYHRDTNPKLKSREDIIIFNDAVSAYSYTLAAVLSMITNSNVENELDYDMRVDLIDIFHAVGFDTYWISNQPPIGVSESLISAIGYNKATNSTFVNLTSNSTYESDIKSSYDEKLLKPFAKALKDKASKKLIILHLLGNHIKYYSRYPKKFNVYKGDGVKERIIAQYDNSILYNDFILDSIFDMISKHSIENPDLIASSIYTSDHGENVYDELDLYGHSYIKSIPKSNVEIPFLLWMSPSFKAMDSERVEIIKSNVNKPFMVDDLYHFSC
ncbi:phosphoethanolamine transferase [Aureibaculum sp. 2210JD6-5]|uniref:phosphoethanolamine transferase n=1 Tax=Aureibaculum sp. 2210JD6-5 TaxID=3103957 RepID=UPI002AAC560B|nr:phosphoethanolamine transferase [Aureibaculum sp. 2210JD6-5]MDY7396652.1 phosphoethanolamine transferase [Aureibaculum sp. 2210JD6-5]